LWPDERLTILAELSPSEADRWSCDWHLFAHAHQRGPQLEPSNDDWRTWLILGGRGAGKTRAGAEWVRAFAQEKKGARIALIGETEHEAREVMVEGVSGLLAVHPRAERPQWIPSRRRVEWANGTVAEAFSAEDPESLRGPQFHAAWCDELAKWRRVETTFDMLQFGLRLGERPRQVITTTPRPIALIKRLIAEPSTALTHAGTRDNALHLSGAFIDAVFGRYGGTRLGRQELDGEVIEDRPDALWSRALIESCRVDAAPPLNRIVVGLDPPASARAGSDACGLVAAGRGEDGTVFVIADETAGGLSPAAWAAKAIALWRRLEADALVAEVNQGGDMVRAVIAEADGTVPVITVRASRGKWLRADCGLQRHHEYLGFPRPARGARFCDQPLLAGDRERHRPRNPVPACARAPAHAAVGARHVRKPLAKSDRPAHAELHLAVLVLARHWHSHHHRRDARSLVLPRAAVALRRHRGGDHHGSRRLPPRRNRHPSARTRKSGQGKATAGQSLAVVIDRRPVGSQNRDGYRAGLTFGSARLFLFFGSKTASRVARVSLRKPDAKFVHARFTVRRLSACPC